MSSAPLDRLSALPPELLYPIFRQINKPITGIVSNYLLPYTRITVYSNVTIKTLTAYTRFFRTLLTNKSIGALVYTLNVNIENFSIIQSKKIDNRKIVLGLKSLRNLTRLEVCFDSLAVLILSKEVAVTTLPALVKFTLIYPPYNPTSDYDWTTPHLQNLRYYTNSLSVILSPAVHERNDFIPLEDDAATETVEVLLERRDYAEDAIQIVNEFERLDLGQQPFRVSTAFSS